MATLFSKRQSTSGQHQRATGLHEHSSAVAVCSVLAACCVMTGCGDAANTATWDPADRLRRVAASEAENDDASHNHSASDADSPATNAEFVPPYSERLDPFTYVGAEKQTKVVSNSSAKINVKGFVNVGGPQAMLDIDGVTHVVKQGDVIAGIEVVDLAPPNIRLRSLHRTWILGLFDASSAE